MEILADDLSDVTPGYRLDEANPSVRRQSGVGRTSDQGLAGLHDGNLTGSTTSSGLGKPIAFSAASDIGATSARQTAGKRLSVRLV